MRRFVVSLATAVLLASAAAPAASASPTLANWDQAQQRQVLKAGLMQNIRGGFAGAAPLTAGQANTAMAALSARLGGDTGAATARAAGAGPLTVISFDRLMVEQLGLSDVAAHVQAATAAAGLAPPSYLGTEVVARFIGLRYDHPTGTDRLELFPWDRITRAEAAWSLAQAVQHQDWIPYTQQMLSAFTLPSLTGAQAQALRIAVSRIGYPYVWGGTTDNTADGLAHGGFDCSGFVWRVFKLSGLPWGREIGGRTAAQMAGEIPRAQRLRMSQLQPGDLLFFGSAHFNSTATEANVIHTGIYMGNNWLINSSGQGVYVVPLRGTNLGASFAWGRRIVH